MAAESINWEQIGIGTAVGAVAVSTVKYLLGRRKAEADSAVVIARAWEGLLQPLRDENKRLADRVAELERINTNLVIRLEGHGAEGHGAEGHGA